MASVESSASTVPIPALLVERALDLARAEAGLALVHTRRIAVRAVSALLGTIVACAFAQLTLILLVLWPVLSASIPVVNLLAGVLVSFVLAAAGAAFAIATWARVARERSSSGHSSAEASAAVAGAPKAKAIAADTAAAKGKGAAADRASRASDTREQPRTASLTERVTQ
jgi:membrane protein implicated in regulation of membrane protease activity